MSNNDTDTDTEPFIIKKIYTELFKDYVLNERENYKNKDEKKNVAMKKLHPHHFYFADFVPDIQFDNLFGINLVTFSNKETDYESFQERLSKSKFFKVETIVNPIPIDSKIKTHYNTPKNFALDYDIDIEEGLTSDLKLILFNKRIDLPLLKVNDFTDFLPEWERIMNNDNSTIGNKDDTSFKLLHRVHNRILNIFKLIITMKNNKVDMTIALNKFLSDEFYLTNKEKEKSHTITTWEELLKILEHKDKDPTTEEIKESHKLFKNLTAENLTALLKDKDNSKKYKALKKNANEQTDEGKQAKQFLNDIKNIKNRKINRGGNNNLDNIKLKQLQHEIFITINFIKKTVDFLKGIWEITNEDNFFIKYCETLAEQLSVLFKSVDTTQNMKNLEIRVIYCKVDKINEFDLPFISHFTLEIYNPNLSIGKVNSITKALSNNAVNTANKLTPIKRVNPFKKDSNDDDKFSKKELKEFQRKYSDIETIINRINLGINPDLPNENKNRQAYNSITTKDIRIAINKYYSDEQQKEVLKKALEDKQQFETISKETSEIIRRQSKLEPFKNINLTFKIKTPVIPFYGEVGHITPLKNELHEPIFENDNFTHKWKSNLNESGRNFGSVTNRKYVLYKGLSGQSLDIIVEPLKEEPQKQSKKNVFYSKNIETSNDSLEKDSIEEYLKQSKNKLETSTEEGKIMTLIDRNNKDYDPDSRGKTTFGWLKSMAGSAIDSASPTDRVYSVYKTFHSKLFYETYKKLNKADKYSDVFENKLIPDKETTGKIMFKTLVPNNKKEPIISIDDVETFNFFAFITGLTYPEVVETDSEDSFEEKLTQSIAEKAVSIYELENCVDPFISKALSKKEKINSKVKCWSEPNKLTIFTLGHFSRLPYTSRNILQEYTTKNMPDKEMQDLYDSFGYKNEPVNNEYPIIDLYDAWYNIIPWFSGFSATLPGETSKNKKGSRIYRIPYKIDEEFSESRDGNIRVYNFLNQQIYMFYLEEFYNAYWLRRDVNFNNTYFNKVNVDTKLTEESCVDKGRPISCKQIQTGGGVDDDEDGTSDKESILNPKPIKPKVSYGETIPITFSHKSTEQEDNEPKIVAYEDPNIDLIPKIILRSDSVKELKELSGKNEQYKTLRLIRDYLKTLATENNDEIKKDSFASDFTSFLHVIGVKKINYNVFNDICGNTICKERSEAKKQFYGSDSKNALDNIIDGTAQLGKALSDVVSVSEDDKNEKKINEMEEKGQKILKDIQIDLNTLSNVKDEKVVENIKALQEKGKKTLDDIETGLKSQIDATKSIKDLQEKGTETLNDMKTTLKSQNDATKSLEALQEKGKDTLNEIKIKSALSKVEKNKTRFSDLRNLKLKSIFKGGGDTESAQPCIRYDHTNIRSAIFASKWMNRTYYLDFMDSTKDSNAIDTSINPNNKNKYYGDDDTNTNPIDIIVKKDDLTCEFVYNLKYREIPLDDNNPDSYPGSVLGTFGNRISRDDLINDKDGAINKVNEVFLNTINKEVFNEEDPEENAQGTMYSLLINLAKTVKIEEFLTQPSYDFMQSIERLMFRIENNPTKQSVLNALGLDFENKAKKLDEDETNLLNELREKERNARKIQNTMIMIAAYLVSNKLFSEDSELQINMLKEKGENILNSIKNDIGDSVNIQQGGKKNVLQLVNLGVSTILDDIKYLERALNIRQSGGASIITKDNFSKFTDLIYNCSKPKTSDSKKNSIQEFIKNRYPKALGKSENVLAKLYKKCQPQQGGTLVGGALGAKFDENVRNARQELINITKTQGLEELVKNPYFIPHEFDPYIADHHFSFTQPCPEGKAATLCSLFSLLAGRKTKGGGGNKNTISTIKGKRDRLASGINNRLGLTDKKNVALERFGSIFKSPEGASRVTAGVKNTRNALLNNGVVRAIKDRNVNPNNVPYIMNEGKLKNYLQLMYWYFLGDMLLSDEQISNNMTVRSGRRIDPPKRGQKAKVYSDDLKRESTALTLNVDPNTAKKAFMPKIVNSRRLIANANNVVLGNTNDKHLTDPQYEKVYRGNYGKIVPRKGDDIALAFWLGFR